MHQDITTRNVTLQLNTQVNPFGDDKVISGSYTDTYL